MTGAAGRGPWGSGVLDVQAHAGAQGYFVGNTWPAFEHAVQQGVRNVEFDVRVTADDVPIVWHDLVIDPKDALARDRRLYGRRIDELTYDELRPVEVGVVTQRELPRQRPVAGVGFLTLEELFTRLSALCPQMWFTVEIKLESWDPLQVRRRETILRAVLAAIDAGGVRSRVIVHSFDWALLELAARRAPDLPRSALASHGETWVPGSPFVGERTYVECGGDLALAAYRLGVDAVAPRWCDQRGVLVADRAFVDRAHALGLAVNPWTVDAPRDQIRLLRAGVDGIVTNYPDRLLAQAGSLPLVRTAATTRQDGGAQSLPRRYFRPTVMSCCG